MNPMTEKIKINLYCIKIIRCKITRNSWCFFVCVVYPIRDMYWCQVTNQRHENVKFCLKKLGFQTFHSVKCNIFYIFHIKMSCFSSVKLSLLKSFKFSYAYFKAFQFFLFIIKINDTLYI